MFFFLLKDDGGRTASPLGKKGVNIFPSVLWYWHWFVLKNFPARNIFVFTLALSDLLLAASIPLTLGDALTQVILNIWFTWNWISLRMKYWTTYYNNYIEKMEETLQFEMLQPRWFSILEIDVDIKTCDCIASHVVVPGAQCTACMEAFCTGNNHDLYALVNVIFHVLNIFM